MPKTVIREYDNSTSGSTLTPNFAVFVPGYASKAQSDELIKKAKEEGIYFDIDKIYQLSSTDQFKTYIGEDPQINENVAPVLKVVNEAIPEGQVIPGEEGAEPTYTGYTRYLRQLKVKDFRDNTEEKFYTMTELTDASDARLGKSGYLYYTITYTNGVKKTYIFNQVSEDELWEDLPAEEIAEVDPLDAITYGRTKGLYATIAVGNEGLNKTELYNHLGNQIALELLSVGYPVYFKVLDPSQEPTVQMQQEAFWAPLKNKAQYRLRYLTTGGCYDETVAAKMSAIANFNNTIELEKADTYGNECGRGDVIALIDANEEYSYLDGSTTKKPFETAKTRVEILNAFSKAIAVLPHNKYTAIFGPRVVYKNDLATKYPCSFHYLLCAAEAKQRFAEWYAVAGYTRGLSSRSIAYTTYTFGDIDINTLAPRKENNYVAADSSSINLILNERGNYYLWGNRTSEPLGTKGLRFSHFLNIRQLCCTLKQNIYDASREFTFDPNSDLLWINFVNAIRPTLENMKADQGIKAYKISKVATAKKALLIAKIRIVPIEALEDFDISIYLEDSEEGIVVSADESVAE